MNRRNRRPIRNPSTPIVIQVQSAPAPVQVEGASASEKGSKLPEWASLTAIVTGVTASAFTTSAFFVLGASLGVGTPLADYFSPADYLRIAPSWLLPTLIFSLIVVSLYLVASLLFLFSLRTFTLIVPVFKRPRTEYWERIFNTLNNFFPLVALESETRRFFNLLAMLDWAPKLFGRRPLIFWFLLFSAFCLSMWGLYRLNLYAILFSAVFFLFVFTSFLPVDAVIKLVLMLVVWCALFSMFTGFERYRGGAPGVLATVFFESGEGKVDSIEGFVIFDLDRYLLISPERKLVMDQVLAIPHEKIKSIQTPPP